MIYPTTRLLGWVALVTLPAGLMALPLPEMVMPLLGLCVFGLILILWDASRLQATFKSLRLEFDDVIRLTTRRPSPVPLRFYIEEGRRGQVSIECIWPETIAVEPEKCLIEVSAQDEGMIELKITPAKRGVFQLQSAFVIYESPLRLWSMKRHLTLKSEIRVYPDLKSESRQLASVLLRGGPGQHRFRKVGQGREFEQLREYLPGDSYDEVDWKATAKRGEPVTRVFRVEQHQEIYLAMDTSRFSMRPVQSGDEEEPVPIIEHWIRSSLALASVVGRQNDSFGMITFDDRIRSFIRAGSGQSHYETCRDTICAIKSRPVTPDYEELVVSLRRRLRRRAMIIILTMIDDPYQASLLQSALRILCRQHLILVAYHRARDSRVLFSEPVASEYDIYSSLSGHLIYRELKECELELKRIGITVLPVDASTLSSQLVSRYLEVKQRQIL